MNDRPATQGFKDTHLIEHAEEQQSQPATTSKLTQNTGSKLQPPQQGNIPVLPQFRHKFVNNTRELNVVYEQQVPKGKKPKSIINQAGMWNPTLHPHPQVHHMPYSNRPKVLGQTSQSQET